MSRGREKRHDGVEPSVSMIMHILNYTEERGLTLKELFVKDRDEGDLTLSYLLETAYLKVIEVFQITEMIDVGRVRRPRRTDHYLPGMSDSVDRLLGLISIRVRSVRDFVRISDLPPQYQRLNSHWREKICSQARYLLLREVIYQLVTENTKLWYHAGHERWQASQSMIDDYGPLLRKHKGLPRPKRQPKWDDHSYHGRPRRDRHGRGVLPGVSVSLSH